MSFKDYARGNTGYQTITLTGWSGQIDVTYVIERKEPDFSKIEEKALEIAKKPMVAFLSMMDSLGLLQRNSSLYEVARDYVKNNYPELQIEELDRHGSCFFNHGGETALVGMMLPQLKELKTKYGESAEVAVFLHEVGHYLDWKYTNKKFTKDSGRSGFGFMSNHEGRNNHRLEKRANQNAIALAKKIGIRVDGVFLKSLHWGLKSYGIAPKECISFFGNQKRLGINPEAKKVEAFSLIKGMNLCKKKMEKHLNTLLPVEIVKNQHTIEPSAVVLVGKFGERKRSQKIQPKKKKVA